MKNTKLTILASVFVAGALVACSTPRYQGALAVVSWGGQYSVSQQNAYHDPYMAQNPHIKIVNDDSSYRAVKQLHVMNKTGNLTWDLVDVLAADSTGLCDKGLARKMDFDNDLAPGADGSKPTDDFGNLLVDDCFIPSVVYSFTFGYRTNVAEWNGRVPTSIKDVFDLDKFPGKRSLERIPDNNMEWALLADGVPADQIYEVLSTEEGIQRAFAKLDTIKDEVIWWSAGVETPQRLADEQVVMGSSWNGRFFSLIEQEKYPVAMLWDWQVLDIDGWIIPAGLPPDREKAVLDLVRFATDTQRLADQAQYIPYGPARKSSIPLVGRHAELGVDMAPHMPNAPENTKHALLYNHRWWADNEDKLNERFEAWLSQ